MNRRLVATIAIALALPWVAAHAAEDAPRPRFVVAFEKERLTVKAEAAPTVEVLDAIAEKANVEVAGREKLSRPTVSLDLENVELEDGMRTVLRAAGAENVAVIHRAKSEKRIAFVVVAAGGPNATPTARVGETGSAKADAAEGVDAGAAEQGGKDQKRTKKAEIKRRQEEYTRGNLERMKDPAYGAEKRATRERTRRLVEDRMRQKREGEGRSRFGKLGEKLGLGSKESTDGEAP